MCLSTDRYQMIKYPNPWTAIHHWKLVLSFNRVRHKGLLLKIQDLGTRGNLYKVIEIFIVIDIRKLYTALWVDLKWLAILRERNYNTSSYYSSIITGKNCVLLIQDKDFLK